MSIISSACLVQTQATRGNQYLEWLNPAHNTTICWVVGIHACEILNLLNTTTSGTPIWSEIPWLPKSIAIESRKVQDGMVRAHRHRTIRYICNGKMPWTHRWLGSVKTNKAPLENFKFTRHVEQHISADNFLRMLGVYTSRERKYSARSHNTAIIVWVADPTCVWDLEFVTLYDVGAPRRSGIPSQPKAIAITESSRQCPRDDASFCAASP